MTEDCISGKDLPEMALPVKVSNKSYKHLNMSMFYL